MDLERARTMRSDRLIMLPPRHTDKRAIQAVIELSRLQQTQPSGLCLNQGYQLFHVHGGVELSAATQDWFRSSLIQQMPDLKLSEYFAIRSDWFSAFNHLIIAVDQIGSQVVGILASCWHTIPAGIDFLQATTQLISPSWQRSTMLRQMWRMHMSALERAARPFPPIIAIKTCNPSAFRAVFAFASVPGISFYPRLEDTTQTPEMIVIARQIAARISPGKDFDPETAIIKNAGVPPDFYPSVPTGVRDGVIEKYFRENLTASDRLLCFAWIRTQAARQRVLRAFGATASMQAVRGE